ncbi:hypothetical protein [Streptomyces apocyni]|uniref:hypothetical protein n=1 Tax=Streptomyces apocyni TaxID=2654677 RepID=UPI0012EABE00|nr:hypothetical protein [Streptomyces apocyni]
MDASGEEREAEDGCGGAREPELRTLRQKVEYMVEKNFPGQRISGRCFAELVRERGGSLSHSYYSNILAGKVTDPSEEILKALGLGFGVDWRFFKEESEVVDDVLAGLRFLAQRRTGQLSGLAARGLDDGTLPPELVQFALSLLAEAQVAAEQHAQHPQNPHSPQNPQSSPDTDRTPPQP